MTRLLSDGRALLLVAGLATIGVACAAPPASTPPPPPDYAAELGPVAAAFIDVWNTKEYARLDDILSPEFRRRAPDADADGLDGMKEFMRQAHATYADFHIVVEESACKRDACFLLWTVTGKVMGEGDDPGDAKSVETPGITLLRFDDGKITEEIVHYDTAALMNQLGLSAVPHVAAE